MILSRLARKANGEITTSAELAALLARGLETSSGVPVSPESMIRFAYVFMCVRVLAEGVGMLPIHLMRQVGRAREKATAHHLYPLLHGAPNRLETTQEWLERLVVELCLRGNHYDYINRIDLGGGRSEVVELLPLHPDAVVPSLSDDGADVRYTVNFKKGGQRTLTSREVFHVKLFSRDGVKGMTPIQAADTLGLGVALERYASRFFKNGARPGGILTTEQVLGDDGRADVEKSWNEQRQGVDKAHGIAVLEHGFKYMAIGLSAEDAQMIEARKMSRTDICGLFRVPPAMIADLERATFNNGEHQGRNFVDYSLMPFLTRIESRVDMQLLDERDRGSHYAKFNVGALVRGDMKTRGEFYTRQVQNGALSPNEIREFEDMDPREGGDIYLTPANMLIDGKPPPEPAPEKAGV